MGNQPEQQRLEQYAAIAKRRIFASQSDLSPKDHAMEDMLVWCREQGNIVVLQSGDILSNDPTDRTVQNCKIVMAKKQLEIGDIYPATQNLIQLLLENAIDHQTENSTDIADVVSTQQQRLRMLVQEALSLGASDIHIEVRKDLAKIRFRKHGELFLHAQWLPKLGREIASVAFNKETDHAVTHFNPLVPQNASMPLNINGQEIRLRLASLPAHGGFDVVMRLLTTADRHIASLEELGYLPDQIELIKKAVNMPYGAVILSGPTGSGKTTTLASCMQMVDGKRKVYTIEDPVEKFVDTATQVPVNTEHYDRSFASMARTALRMDPDVMVLGEMRDEDTATIMMRAAITGHLVFSTLHTSTATGIVTRMQDLGISKSLLASPNLLVCLICQRLVPVLCQACAVPVTQSERCREHLPRLEKAFHDDLSSVFARGNGDCHVCHGLGISGRKVVAEIIWMTEQDRQFIFDGDLLGWNQHLKKSGWVSYQEQLMDLVKSGQCDPFDAEKLGGQLTASAGSANLQTARVE